MRLAELNKFNNSGAQMSYDTEILLIAFLE